MKNITLKSAARLSKLVVKDFNAGASVDITYLDDTRTLAGTYKWEEVKQFVRELAEALDMTLEETAPEVEPIVLPKDVYEEVAEMKESVDEAEDAQEARARADRKIWKSCRESPNDSAIARWVDTTDGATLDLAKILMGELPFKCEREPVWLLEQTYNRGNFLCKAYVNNTGGWTLEFSGTPIHFPSYEKASDFAETVSYMAYLSVKEV
ncbi:hypothetical protein EC99P1_00041 [Enterococcus phage EC99P1]|nr:hypothetical protein EC99P1_00041 [Enterococcus phage EC99P1]